MLNREQDNHKCERAAKADLTARMIIVHGPTGVGKTDFVDKLAQLLPIEIINMDMGQQYAPLSIGTAKPDWRNSPTPQHLFDVFDAPLNGTVSSYRARVCEKLTEIIGRNRVPVLVGGSGFYLKSLLFPPLAVVGDTNLDAQQYHEENKHLWWSFLAAIDPERAACIDKHDFYRIKRALAIWHETGVKPSLCKPLYNPPLPYSVFFLTRDIDDLYRGINERVIKMLDAGWLDEVKALRGSAWQEFIRAKKIIGYQELFGYLDGALTQKLMVTKIQQATRNYAKRQQTFWRMMVREINSATAKSNLLSPITTINLTDTPSDLYINELLNGIAR